MSGQVESRLCNDCGREVEDGSAKPWHCRYCGPLDEDDTHTETAAQSQVEVLEAELETARKEALHWSGAAFERLGERQAAEDRIENAREILMRHQRGESGEPFEEAAAVIRPALEALGETQSGASEVGREVLEAENVELREKLQSQEEAKATARWWRDREKRRADDNALVIRCVRADLRASNERAEKAKGVIDYIAESFIPDESSPNGWKTYGGPVATLDAIRRKVRVFSETEGER